MTFVTCISFAIIKIIAIMNVVIAVISLRKLDLIQLNKRFNVFVIKLYLKKFIT